MKHCILHTAAVLAVLASVALVTNAAAQGILDNTSNPLNGDDQVNSSVSLAQSFTTGGDATSLSTISPDFFNNSGNGFQLALFTDSAGSVGDFMAALNGPDSPNYGVQAYTADSPIALTPFTTYWWVATSGDGSFNLFYTYSSANESTDGWSINSSYAGNTGEGWYSYGLNGPQLMFIVGAEITPTPEPSTLALVALGLGSGALFLRRRPTR